MSLQSIRSYCLSLPQATESEPFGDPIWAVHGNWFAIYTEMQGRSLISFRVDPSARALLLEDGRFVQTPFVGRNSWVSMLLASGPDNDELRALLSASYRIAAAEPTHRARKRPNKPSAEPAPEDATSHPRRSASA